MGKDNKEIIGIVSGYFMILHGGHLDLLEDTCNYCGTLIAIVNNDIQLMRKHNHPPPINHAERVRILDSIYYVDHTYLSIDTDSSVCKTLEMIRDKYKESSLLFMNGGDVTQCLEDETCKRLDIKTLFNVGGTKSNSSSKIWAEARKYWEMEEMKVKCGDGISQSIKEIIKNSNTLPYLPYRPIKEI